ncbi:hypothetical protein MRB53_030191 [Persea americana]|uniref:Uncharacterized protein n=1 Tax=Persea americana TaxID=3435 RepID=A0ACC2KLL1_PERAE|nr:hypothetical protein MRB53_030191 [Persea americana]
MGRKGGVETGEERWGDGCRGWCGGDGVVRWKGEMGDDASKEYAWVIGKMEMGGGSGRLGSAQGCEREGRCDGWEDDEFEMGSGKEILFRSLAVRRRRQYYEDEESAPEGGGACKGRCCDDAE